MNLSHRQAEIDAISWYHDFDFGNGLRARPDTTRTVHHRSIWRFIEQQLDRIDFHGKSVLDIGCWDGYWSFYAERRGAKRVLATDDRTQNWSDGKGIHLAKELLASSVTINQEMPIYELRNLNEKFDIILCLGVYYHLLDPFYAFAQVRHCCHRDSLVILEGNVATGLPANGVLLDRADYGSEFSPSFGALEQLVQAAYLTEIDHAYMEPPRSLRAGWKPMLRKYLPVLSEFLARLYNSIHRTGRQVRTTSMRRLILKCAPFEGTNEIHFYKPPFGLDAYDPRFRMPGEKRFSPIRRE